MPSLRQRVTTYFRQLSFIAEPRDDRNLSPKHAEDGSFITKYLEGRYECSPSVPEILHGKEPIDLLDYPLDKYETGPTTITAACTGPNEGLAGVRRSKLHLSAGPDIDFIDTNQELEGEIRQSASITSLSKTRGRSYGIKSDQNANKPPIYRKPNPRKISLHQLQSSVADSSAKVDSHLNKNGNASNFEINQKTSKPLDTSSADKINQNINVAGEIKGDKTDLINVETLDPIANVSNWNQSNDDAYGISVSLYEKNPVSNEYAGNPIADCFGLVARGNTTALALADGVNWGEGARLAARSAVQGCLEYIDTAIFGQGQGGMATTTREVLVSLLRSFWEAHGCILEVGGALSTLTVAVILPLGSNLKGKYVVCACNVGDSLGYVYSKIHGVREFTQGSHDINSMRDMRDALGALGPVDGNKPELSNLTLSLTIVEVGDIVFLTSDGISDNFDPVVGKFAEALTNESQIVNPPTTIEPQLAPKRQNKSASSLSTRKTDLFDTKLQKQVVNSKFSTTTASTSSDMPKKPPRVKKSASSAGTSSSTSSPKIQPNRPKYLRSQTVIEPRLKLNRSPPARKFPKSAAGLPLVTGVQRHTLTLLRLADLLCYGINGTLRPCTNAKKLCQLLVDFASMITSAKRKLLEQRELYYKIITDIDGRRKEVELSRNQQRGARKRMVEGSTFSTLPGKLDHASVVAVTIGCCNKAYNETDF